MASTSLPREARERAVRFLRRPRERWVDLLVTSHRRAVGTEVRSTHRLDGRLLLQEFATCWARDDVPKTEFGHGMSVIHDAKDHYLYGLGITPLTEFQTIVQTYLGRELAGGSANRARDGDWAGRIQLAIYEEMFGPRGPRVYGAAQDGLLDQFAPDGSRAQRATAFEHMVHICLGIMLPRLRELYLSHDAARVLQASTLDQPELVEACLPGVVWADRDRLLMTLRDNADLRIETRAYVDDDLWHVTRSIGSAVREHVAQHPDLHRFGRIFSTDGYSLR
ncbi:MAG: hypothetical protein AB7J32_08610 [Pseudonocardia sp.]